MWTSAVHEMRDDVHTEMTHRISIDLPSRIDALDRPPLIVCLDGAWTAGTVRDVTRLMSMSGEAPEAIVAGISFDTVSMSDYLRARARWFTPTAWVPPPEVGVRDVVASDLGRADTYRAFLRERALPWIADQCDHGEVWMVGHSFSALFGLKTLLHEPGLFDAYLLASPSIWWHDRAILAIEEQGEVPREDVVARVFMSAGDAEMGDSALDDTFRMRDNMIEMADRLGSDRYPNLHLARHVFAGESHSSTVSTAISTGIRALHAASTGGAH